MGSGVDSGEIALAEVLALRSLLLNLHFRAAKGEPVAEAEMRGLIERADANKMRRALEALAKNSTREERMQAPAHKPALPRVPVVVASRKEMRAMLALSGLASNHSH
jgi:hypothetical protein